jgi:hypothetical protein
MNAPSETRKHSAAGQYLGYSLQPVRLCYHLLTAPEGASVSLEHIDDVAVHLANGNTILEQNKSALSQNPISDWAADLWKTLANWLSFIAAGEVALQGTSFRLYVTPIKSGGFATELSLAASDLEVAALTKKLHKRLAKQAKRPKCSADVQAFLDADPIQRAELVKNFRIVSTDTDPVDPIRAVFKPTVSPAILEFVCERAIGAAKEAADRLLRAGQPALLDADIFRAEQREFVQRNNLPGLLNSLTNPPSSTEVAEKMAERPAFVRQLELIEVYDEARVRAVSDYLRTIADISKWGELGLIFEKNLEDWDDDLIRKYEQIAGETQDVHADKVPAARGRIVYWRCAQLQPPLDGRAVAGHFVHGSFNCLAHDLRLGWHPDYKNLMGVQVD